VLKCPVVDTAIVFDASLRNQTVTATIFLSSCPGKLVLQTCRNVIL